MVALGIVYGTTKLDSIRNFFTTSYKVGDAVCDPNIRTTLQSGNWYPRWGYFAYSFFAPPIHYCYSDPYSGFLTTGDKNASVLVWNAGAPGAKSRSANVSFMVPNLTNWSHLATFAGWDPATLGRIGAAVFRDKLFVELVYSGDVGCNGTNLFPMSGVAIPGGIVALRWYRINSGISKLDDGRLSVKVGLQDLARGGLTIATANYTFPASCTPPWFTSSNNRWAFGILGLAPRVTTYVDDFFGRPY